VEVYGRGRPQPAPIDERIKPERASWAWIHETTSPDEHKHRSEKTDQEGGLEWAVRRGKEIILTSFWALVWAGIIEEVGNGKYRLKKAVMAATNPRGFGGVSAAINPTETKEQE
jgi:hypothetical protein